jgi:hypothetical protein
MIASIPWPPTIFSLTLSYVIFGSSCAYMLSWSWSHLLIINLTSHDLIMEIMQILFNHNLCTSHIKIVYWKHIWNTDSLEDSKIMWHFFIHRFVLHLSTHLFMCQTCFQCMIFMCKMYESMNEWILHEFCH